MLLGLMVSIGVGSALFHTLATGPTRLLDALAIAVFIVVFLWLYSRRVLKLNHLSALILSAAFVAAALVGRQSPHVLNGSLIYAPALLFIFGLGLVHLFQARHARFGLLSAAGVFVVSLFFRVIDSSVCESFPWGTHFLWHLCNAVVLYIAARTLLGALEKLARRRNCSCISINLLNPHMRRWLREPLRPAVDLFRAAGYRGEPMRLRKCFQAAD